MLSVIKTAIITIIISFISGVLLDHYKNVAPRIVCHIGKETPVRLKNRRIKAYILTVKNISKKTIHDLNLNLQASCEKFKIDDAKITKGLKFDLSNEGSIYNVSIPFLSKNDVFSVKVFLEGSEGNSRPIIALRSPENFKRIDSDDEEGIINSVKSIPENISEFFTNVKNSKESNNAEKNFFRNKKAIITIASAILLIFAGVLTTKYLKSSSEPASSNQSVKNEQESEDIGNSNAKPTTSTESNEKSKTTGKSEGSGKQESSGTENNSGLSTSNNSSGKNAKTSNNSGSGANTVKNSGDSKARSEGSTGEESSSGANKSGGTKSSEGSSTEKTSGSKETSNDENKTISQGNEPKAGTEAPKTP